MNVNFKVIPDMVMKEGEVYNLYAGINFLEQFYNIKGYSTPILIYCNDTEKVIANAWKQKREHIQNNKLST